MIKRLLCLGLVLLLTQGTKAGFEIGITGPGEYSTALAGTSVVETIFINALGGVVGVLVFVLLSEFLVNRYKKKLEKRKLNNELAGKPIKVFTRKNKIIVFIKRKFGLLGIAFLSPVLFSVPLGCFLAIRYFKVKQKVLAYMFGSVIFWSFFTPLAFNPIVNAIRSYFS